MSSRKLTEIDKAYIEKFCHTKDANTITKELKKSGVIGIGVKSVQQYINIYKYQNNKVEMDAENIKVDIPPTIDPIELAGKHDRGGVITMTQGLSELLDEESKKTSVHDYSGKIHKIRKDKPIPKGIKVDE